MSDRYLPAILRADKLALGVATTSSTCRAAQQAHDLGSTSSIALGRLLTAAALAGLVQERPGELSLQVLATGRLGQVYADATPEGALRGYVKDRSLALPVFPGERPDGRRSIGVACGTGSLVVMRLGEGTAFTRSTTELTSGELDLDVEHHLSSSDQIPTALACDVLLGKGSEVVHAGGVIVQGLPGADPARLASLGAELRQRLPEVLAAGGGAHEVLKALAPDAEALPGARDLAWRCRCSEDRVLRALRSLDTVTLADMVDKREAPRLDCHFCGRQYDVGAEVVAEIYRERLGQPD